MGLFSGHDPGEAVTYTGSRPGLFGAIGRPHGLKIQPGEHGVVIARHESLFRPVRYDVRFGQTVVRDVPAAEVQTDAWGTALPTLADRPGSAGGAIDRMLTEDPFVGCLASWLVWTVGAVMAVVYTVAGMAWLGGRVWAWRYGTDLSGHAARAWVGAAVIVGPIAALCLARAFVFPRLFTTTAGAALAIVGWCSWYLGPTAGGPATAATAEAGVVAVAGTAVIVLNLFRLRGGDLHDSVFWYPLAALATWLAVDRYRSDPLLTWDNKGTSAWTTIATIALVGLAAYLWSVAVHQAATAPAAPQIQRLFSLVELVFAVTLPMITLALIARTTPGMIAAIPRFGLIAEILIMFPIVLGVLGFTWAWILHQTWRPLMTALTRRGVEVRRWEWARNGSYVIPIVLEIVYRYR